MAIELDRRVVWIGLIAVYLVSCGILTLGAPGGLWQNQVFDIGMAWDNDPGGSYLAGAHELGPSGTMLFAGHPGLPMQIALSLLQWLGYLLSGSGLTFTAYSARHLDELWATAKIASAVAHVLSFFSFHAFARAALGSRRAADLATATYATSLPVLYYSSRISPEPWMVTFFCFSFVAIARSHQMMTLGRMKSAHLWSFAAGAASVSAAFSKALLMAALPFVCVGFLLASGGALAASPALAARRRMIQGVTFGAGCLALTLIYSTFMDWQEFGRLWHDLLRPGFRASAAGTVDSSWATKLSLQAQLAWQAFQVKAMRPQFRWAQVFAYCEFPLLAIGGWGAALLVGSREAGSLVRWPVAYALFTLGIWFLRSPGRAWADFHYLFLVVVVSAVGFSSVLLRLIGRETALSWWKVVAVLTLMLHSASLWAAFDGRLQDIKQYRALRFEGYYRALSSLGEGETILVVGPFVAKFHGLTTEYSKPGHESALAQEIEGRFIELARVPLEEREPAILRQKHIGRVLDLRGPVAVVCAIADWQGPPSLGCAGGKLAE